ncbi:MAG TPA: aldehyde dehydrogenase family protein [Candidatus Baltobacteraceae bacterium]|jgi:aldehyde dehydrogenase|nr:aldehyde dehydrogenase family protein [Candidatus Baltobacteraceae bacterium]
MSAALNESLIREVVEEVLGRLGPGKSTDGRAPKTDCDCHKNHSSAGSGQFGVFEDADAACDAAGAAFVKLQQGGIAARKKVVSIVKTLAEANAVEWGRAELEETKIGRLDHKIEKLQIIKNVPGVEWLRPEGLSGDHGITLEEFTPFGVVGAVTPSTHSIPTLSGNIVNIVAAGNAVVFNAHPGASRCAAMAIGAYNRAIQRETGIENLCCIIEHPTLESFSALCAHEQVRLLCVTGGPAVVNAAMKAGKRAICAGPGNPPVLVDDTASMKRAARAIVQGASYDNNLLCIGEKEVFALETIADELMSELENNGAFRLDSAQLERLTKAAFIFKEGQGGGCADPVVNKEFIGKDPSVLARAAGVNIPEGTQLLFAETGGDHPFVIEEQMMPFIPVVRVKSVEDGIAAAKQAEHNYKHTSIIHSHDVEHMTAMARALDTTLFIKNGPCMAGLGLGGEGYLSYSIATPTGEGVTNPKTFTRVRRCVMVDNLRIY